MTVITPRKQHFAPIYMYKAILFSEEHSDATIICEDDVAFPVHKICLPPHPRTSRQCSVETERKTRAESSRHVI